MVAGYRTNTLLHSSLEKKAKQNMCTRGRVKIQFMVFCLVLATAGVRSNKVTEKYFNAGSERLEINVDSYFPLDGINEMISDEEMEKYGRQRISDDKFKQFHSILNNKEDDMKGKRVKYDLKMKSRRAKRQAAGVSKTGGSFDLNYDNVDSKLFGKLIVKQRTRSSNSRKNRQVIGKFLKDPLYPDDRNLKLSLPATPNAQNPISQSDEDTYDYNAFHKEYYADLVSQERDNLLFSPQPEKKLSIMNLTNLFKRTSQSNNETFCSADDWKSGVGFIAIICILQQGIRHGFTQEVLYRYLDIVKFWAIAYAVIGGFMWISCGYCCCCLNCKIFKPDLIRKEARAYLVNNPPGIAINDEGKIQYYDPPEYELKAYRELEVKAFAFI